VTKVGKNVENINIGDHVGVGCIVDSCSECHNCKEKNQHMCNKGFTHTYGKIIKHGKCGKIGDVTYGG